jgi:hypothetical protein
LSLVFCLLRNSVDLFSNFFYVILILKICCCYIKKGKVAEWLIAPILKIGVALRPPGVRIPPFPKNKIHKNKIKTCQCIHDVEALLNKAKSQLFIHEIAMRKERLLNTFICFLKSCVNIENKLSWKRNETKSFAMKHHRELVAQWTRAHGYEPCGRGFESLLARKIK